MFKVEVNRWNQTPEDLKKLSLMAKHSRARVKFISNRVVGK